jgi:hypothetical protein
MKRSCQWVGERFGLENAEVEEHLRECADCAEAFQSTVQLRRRLQSAVAATDVPPTLASRVQRRLNTGKPTQRFMVTLLAAAAVFVLSVGIAYRGSFGPEESESAMWERLSAAESPVMRVGLHDHVHCALFQKFGDKGRPIAVLTRNLAPEFGDLAKIVQQNVPELRVIEAHKCKVAGRDYFHVIARKGARTMSLVVTARRTGETLEGEVSDHTGELNIAAFETPGHLVYLVSNLDAQANLTTMRAMTPALRDVFRRVEL